VSAYPDTSFLCALYRLQFDSAKAAEYFKRLAGPLWVTSLLLFEFRQSVRLQVWLNGRDKNKGFGANEAAQMLAALNSDLAAGALKVVTADWSAVHAIAESLSAKHTIVQGFRAMDTLHVATAIHLGAREFVTMDGNQKMLAAAEGLAVRP